MARALACGIIAVGVFATSLAVNRVDAVGRTHMSAGAPKSAYECAGRLSLKPGSQSRIVMTLFCEEPFYGLRVDVNLLSRNRKRFVAGNIKGFWRHLRVIGSDEPAGFNECRRLGARLGVRPGVACYVEKIDDDVTILGELVLTRGERCKRELMLGQEISAATGEPDAPGPYPAIKIEALFRGKPLGCPIQKKVARPAVGGLIKPFRWSDQFAEDW
jgi:hypothetical protein